MLVARVMFVPTLYDFGLLLTVHHLLVSVQCDKRDILVYNGTDVPEGKWPFMVALRKKETKTGRYCGATLINDNTLLTAAHCLWDKKPEERLAYIGHLELAPVVEADLYPLVKFITHPKYDHDSETHDIGLVKLGRKIGAKLLKKVCLAGPGSDAVGDSCVLVGWGRDGNNDVPNHLKQASMPIMSSEQCSKNKAKPNLICSTRDTCSGDSGGPLLCPTKQNPNQFVQFGIVSQSAKDCKDKGPSYQTKVSEYVDWIAKNAED